ncbi:hypothetical protein [Actinacidiphila sp. bgisy145]|uniref:hypothetical protein n=1 Tax=Actinacidiphila sp. bgisy145 TaxID=3413792 RepID=UPI003EC082D3
MTTPPYDSRNPEGPTGPTGPGGSRGTHGPEGPDDALEMDEQTPRDPHDAQPDDATVQQKPADPVTPAGSAASAGSAGSAAEPAPTAPDAGGDSATAATSVFAASEDTANVRSLTAALFTPDVTPGGADGEGGLDDGLTADEAALRVLMHRAVDGLHASPDALEHLRRAVPMRRQRRRQAILGAAAAALLVCVAVPAVLRVAHRTGHTAAAPVGVGSSYSLAPGTDGHHKGGQADPSDKATHSPDGTRTPSGRSTGHHTTPPVTGAAVPDCSSTQLGQGVSEAGSPDADGRVYGWFRVSNVSASSCTVPSPGVIRAVAHGSADQAAIQVVGHTVGDPASGLPATMSESPIVLLPGQGYEVAFAWVPTTGTGGCTAATTSPTTSTATPTATGTQSSDQGTGSGSSGGSVQSADGASPTTAPASVTLDHTPAAGAPVVTGPVIQGACAGTVYTTAAIAESASTGGAEQ